jgi:hypothetical protein
MFGLDSVPALPERRGKDWLLRTAPDPKSWCSSEQLAPQE